MLGAWSDDQWSSLGGSHCNDMSRGWGPSPDSRVDLAALLMEPSFKSPFPEIDVSQVLALLPTAHYLAQGSFCKVFRVAAWPLQEGSPLHGRAVAVKVLHPAAPATHYWASSEAEAESRRGVRISFRRELAAHALLRDHPRVVRVHCTFSGVGLPPDSWGRPQGDEEVEVMGFVQELCNEGSLESVLESLKERPDLRALWTLPALANQMHALAQQVERLAEAKLVHQDIKPANILVNMVLGANSGTLGATSRLELTLGDLNLCQWTRVAEAGRFVGGTPGFFPARARRAYFTGAGRGESSSHDVYSLGKTLLRLLLCSGAGMDVSCPLMEAEACSLEHIQITMAAAEYVEDRRQLVREWPKELVAFGLTIGLLLSVDDSNPAASAFAARRPAPAQAAALLAAWAALCADHAARPAAFWRGAPAADAGARLYLRLAQLAGVPPLPAQQQVPAPAGAEAPQQQAEPQLERAVRAVLFCGDLQQVRARAARLAGAGPGEAAPARGKKRARSPAARRRGSEP